MSNKQNSEFIEEKIKGMSIDERIMYLRGFKDGMNYARELFNNTYLEKQSHE